MNMLQEVMLDGMDPITKNNFRSMMSLNQTTGLSRSQLLQKLIDPRRDYDSECGFPDTSSLDARTYKDMYNRESVARRVVQILPLECWQTQPSVYEDEDSDVVTPFEQAWDDLGKNLRGKSYYQDEKGNPIWEHLKAADILSGIGRYAVIMLGVDDGQPANTPLEGVIPDGANAAYLGTDSQYSQQLVGNPKKKLMSGADKELKESTLKESTLTTQDPNGEGKKDWEQWQDENLGPHGQQPGQDEELSDPNSDESDLSEEALEDGGNNDNVRGNQPNDTFVKTKLRVQPKDGSEDSEDEDGVRSHGVDPSQPNPQGNRPSQPGRLGQPMKKKIPSQQQPGTMQGTVDRISESDDDDESDVPPGPGADGTPEETDQGTAGAVDENGNPVKPEGPIPYETKLRLVYIREYDETLAPITIFEQDRLHPRYGQPVMYQLTINDPEKSGGGASTNLDTSTIDVHWSRIIHVAEECENSRVFGTPRQQAVFNKILNLNKLYNGSAEMYWRGAFPGLSLETHPQLGGDVSIDFTGAQAALEAYENTLQRHIMTDGMTVKTLSPVVVDPSAQIDTQIVGICLVIGVPQRILMGSERGELASGQDDSTWNGRLKERQNNYITSHIVVEFVDRLIMIGVLPEPVGFSVEWPDLDALQPTEKADLAAKLTQAMASYMSSGLDALMEPKDYFVRILGWDEEEAQAVLDAVQTHLEESYPDATEEIVPGKVPRTEYDEDMAQQDMDAKMEGAKKGGFPGGGGGFPPGKGGFGGPPGGGFPPSGGPKPSGKFKFQKKAKKKAGGFPPVGNQTWNDEQGHQPAGSSRGGEFMPKSGSVSRRTLARRREKLLGGTTKKGKKNKGGFGGSLERDEHGFERTIFGGTKFTMGANPQTPSEYFGVQRPRQVIDPITKRFVKVEGVEKGETPGLGVRARYTSQAVSEHHINKAVDTAVDAAVNKILVGTPILPEQGKRVEAVRSGVKAYAAHLVESLGQATKEFGYAVTHDAVLQAVGSVALLATGVALRAQGAALGSKAGKWVAKGLGELAKKYGPKVAKFFKRGAASAGAKKAASTGGNWTGSVYDYAQKGKMASKGNKARPATYNTLITNAIDQGLTYNETVDALAAILIPEMLMYTLNFNPNHGEGGRFSSGSGGSGGAALAEPPKKRSVGEMLKEGAKHATAFGIGAVDTFAGDIAGTVLGGSVGGLLGAGLGGLFGGPAGARAGRSIGQLGGSVLGQIGGTIGGQQAAEYDVQRLLGKGYETATQVGGLGGILGGVGLRGVVLGKTIRSEQAAAKAAKAARDRESSYGPGWRGSSSSGHTGWEAESAADEAYREAQSRAWADATRGRDAAKKAYEASKQADFASSFSKVAKDQRVAAAVKMHREHGMGEHFHAIWKQMDQTERESFKKAIGAYGTQNAEIDLELFKMMVEYAGMLPKTTSAYWGSDSPVLHDYLMNALTSSEEIVFNGLNVMSINPDMVTNEGTTMLIRMRAKSGLYIPLDAQELLQCNARYRVVKHRSKNGLDLFDLSEVID